MIKKYSMDFSKSVQISKHFSVFEFSSTDNPYAPSKIYSDDIYISEELVDKLETLMTLLGSTACRITSGYRTPEHDLAVGGNGYGQHTKGLAVDCIFKKNGKIIDTSIVSIFAQSVGFRGIARISSSSIHLDMRESGRYYGDETKGTNNVTTDFLSYYGYLH